MPEMNFWVEELIYIALQLILFLPFFFVWIKDRKELEKSNLAVDLGDRFFCWVMYCPIWFIPIVKLLAERSE